MPTTENTGIAFFITPHGFGHATRALAIMSTLRQHDPSLRFHIFSKLPSFLPEQSIPGAYDYHPLDCDVGLIQKTALDIDFPRTFARLSRHYPFPETQIQALAQQLRTLRCRLVVCDIAPMGIAVARAAGIPSVLVENFTWDWIYADYREEARGFAPFIRIHAELNRAATYHIQAAPAGLPVAGAFQAEPIRRKTRLSRARTRARLGVPDNLPLVVITMGGFSLEFSFLEQLRQHPDYVFLLPDLKKHVGDHVLGFTGSSHDAFHPDFFNAADAVIGKLGYSTFAEVYQAGVPFGYIERRNFCESLVLARFIREHMPGLSLNEDAFLDGSWLDRLDELLHQPRYPKPEINGADQAAAFLLDLL